MPHHLKTSKKPLKSRRNSCSTAPQVASNSGLAPGLVTASADEGIVHEDDTEGGFEMARESQGDESDSDPDTELPERKSRAKRRSLAEKVSEILPVLKNARISPFDVIIAIMDESNEEFRSFRAEMHKERNKKLSTFLDIVTASKHGREKLELWLKGPVGGELMHGIIEEEMDTLSGNYKLKGISDITPEYIESREADDFRDTAPFTMRFLFSAAQSERQEYKNIKKKPEQVCNAIMRQLLYQRCGRCLGFAAEFGLYLWATGCSHSTIEAVHRLGLSVCYQTVLNMLETLAESRMSIAKTVASSPHAFCYDNINISTSIHVEQRGLSSTPGKVTSGTLGVLYKLPNATPQVMELQPILDRMRDPTFPGLNFSADLTLTQDQLESVTHQLCVHVINILFKHCDKLDRKSYGTDSLLIHKPRRPLPSNLHTEFFPLRVSTHEEASTKGNLMFQSEVYLDMLGKTAVEMSKWAIPCINDQLTNARIRSGQLLRGEDLNNFHRRLVFQLGIGLFHAALNLSWVILDTHRGTNSQIGSLSYWFTILEKTRLGGAKPDYHTLYVTLIQVLEGISLSAWIKICKEDGQTLEEYALSKPSAEDLRNKADTILRDYLTPLPSVFSTENSSNSSTVPPSVSPIGQKNLLKDKAHQNTRLLMRDTLYLLELVTAVKDGDFKRIEDILPHLAMIYRGAGSNNYCFEVLYLVQNLKYIWPPDFANIMRDSMIVNPSGIPGHFIATDANMEYTIRDLKNLIIVKGLLTTWNQIGNKSAVIPSVKEVKRKIAYQLQLPHQNKGHTDADTKHLIQRVVERVGDENLLSFKSARYGNKRATITKDLLYKGASKLRSSTLKTFNDKFKKFVMGMSSEDVQDEIPTLGLEVGDELNRID